ncbi:hypothetical protein T492DRAFT_844445 [Pavlovales sp. CCMP2436]|nr:hypothetical protein T492DRAFT_844445 [Pavlovales sp. CCMP2436]
MGMASLSTRGAHPLEGGWSSYEPRLALPRAKDPLWLEHPYDIDGNVPLDGGKGSKSKGLLFDDRKLIKRKHKPAPSTAEEVTQCNMSLLPKDLLQVTGGPKVVNFGTISVYTLVHRSFNIANDLLTNVLVTVDAHDELELRQSTPTSQVVPIDVELSVDELDFAFQPTDLNPNITLSVILKNRGTYKADYEAKGPATTAKADYEAKGPTTTAKIAFKGPATTAKRPAAFVVEPAIATVEAGKSKEVLVTFTPTAGAVLDHMLTFIVEGGPSRTLLCKAEYEEPKCTVEPKRCEFGLISVGIPKELSLTVKNSGNEPTVIYWDKPLLGLEMSPLLCTLPANGSVEFTLTLDARAPLKLDAPLSAHVRGGKAIKVHISADAQLPHVSVLQDEFDFGTDEFDLGTVTVGARETRELTLVNTGQLTAGLDLHLTQHAGFEVLYSPPPKSVAQLDEGAEEGDVEQVLQLLSAIADDTGAATARGRPQSAVSERRVSNVDPSRKPLRWELDTSALPVGGLLEIGKDKGLLGTGETETARRSK